MKGQCGLHLLELTLVVAILAVLALTASPHLATTDPALIDLAAQEVADALRCAHAEAIRTGQVHGVKVDYDDSDADHEAITVYRVDTVASPFAIAAVLYHPVDKQPFDRPVTVGTRSHGVRLGNSSAPFTFNGLAGGRRDIHFDAHGAPVLMHDGTSHSLAAAGIVVGNDWEKRTVSVAPITGRVTVQ